LSKLINRGLVVGDCGKIKNQCAVIVGIRDKQIISCGIIGEADWAAY